MDKLETAKRLLEYFDTYHRNPYLSDVEIQRYGSQYCQITGRDITLSSLNNFLYKSVKSPFAMHYLIIYMEEDDPMACFRTESPRLVIHENEMILAKLNFNTDDISTIVESRELNKNWARNTYEEFRKTLMKTIECEKVLKKFDAYTACTITIKLDFSGDDPK